MPTATHTAMGYRATKAIRLIPGHADPIQVFIVHDVEIFSACKREEFNADELWIKASVKDAMAAAREGFFPPLHVRHHERGTDSVRRAGWFEITGVRPITLNGKRRNAVFADLHITDEWVAKEVLDGQLPYRSVEIFDYTEPPCIDGLALLDHEAPYLRLPMLMVSSVDDQTNEKANILPFLQKPEAVACFRKGHSFNPLHRKERDMTTKTSEEIEKPVTNQPTLFADDDKPKDKDDKDKNLEGDEGGGLDVSAVVKAISSGEISVKDMDAILAAIQGQNTEVEPEREQPAPAAAPGAEAMSKQPGTMTAQMAAMQGKIEGLEANDKARDAADVRKDDVDTAMERLKDRPLGADLKERLTKFHKDHGGPAFKPYVDAMAQTTGVLPNDDGKGEAFQGQVGKVPAVAMKYQDKGTDAIDRAAKFAKQWEHLHARGMQTTLEKYVALNMSTPEEIEV